MSATRWVLLYSPFFTGFTSSLILICSCSTVVVMLVSRAWVIGRSYGLSKIALAVVFRFLPLMTRGIVVWVAIYSKYEKQRVK
jgi:hypothetical protein